MMIAIQRFHGVGHDSALDLMKIWLDFQADWQAVTHRPLNSKSSIIVQAPKFWPVTVQLTWQSSPDPNLLRFNRSDFRYWLVKGRKIKHGPVFAALEEIGFVKKNYRLCVGTQYASPPALIFEVRIRWADNKNFHRGYNLL